ncbi:MAG: helix-turn-helix transcriptional regulator, partial [Solirubrobacteraceae bacterium]
MAKDTEKLIRQLSLISYLMAERRPVTALEIRRDVEGYSAMNEDAFARRFYADRSELDALGIQLSVERPIDGVAEQENYSLPPENFFLPAIEFTDSELAALQTALSLLDGEFAYAEPLRLALQQISWGRPNPNTAPAQNSVALGITASAGGHDLSHRLAKVETAIFRRKTITFEYHSIERDEIAQRKVDPYQLLFQGGQFYLVGHAHERDALRVFRLTRMRGKVAYASKAEHDFQRPEDFDPRVYANRIQWQFGEPVGTAEVRIAERVAWQVERHFGRYGEIRAAGSGHTSSTNGWHSNGDSASSGRCDSHKVFSTPYANSRQLISWVLGLGENARLLGPPELLEEMQQRLALLEERHADGFEVAGPGKAKTIPAPGGRESDDPEPKGEAAIRPE